MCGRYALDTTAGELEELYGCECRSHALVHHNITPGTDITAVAHSRKTGKVEAHPVRWGILPKRAQGGAGPVINARIETVASKPTFREGFRERRCIIPASAFYEWHSGTKAPHAVRAADRGLLSFAGLWEPQRDADGALRVHCAIITAQAGRPLSDVHHRSPALLHRRDFARWLDPSGGDDVGGLLGLPKAPREDEVVLWEVSRRVNRPANNDPGLLDPVG